ncbi:MAG: SdrD B-like domain-containing protein [Chloroflexia bacterium]
MQQTRSRSGPGRVLRTVGLPALVLALSILFAVLVARPIRIARAAGTLQVEIIAAYNLVVDSNVSSPSTYAPRVATVIGKFCNTGDADLTNVYGYIGDGATPGTYPTRDSASDPEFQPGQKWDYLHNSGLYAFRHLGPTSDATRSMGTIPAGECRYQYWSFEYPACENLGGTWQEPPCAAGTDPLWGPSIKPDDDFSLQFVIWGTSDQGGDSVTWTMTMRNEISAMANKIKPNPDGQWFNTKSDTVSVGQVITSNGILYEFGNIRQGFDNDGDYVPDYNAWAQPISQVDFDPACFRLIRTSGVLTITRSGGNPTMIVPFRDSLYFTHLPPDNTGVRGEVHYTFLALKGPCSMALTPYQEVASGFDNEKFNGDYGTGIPGVRIEEPAVVITKSSAPYIITVGSTTTYTIPFANTGSAPAGLTLNSGYGVEMPLVVSDTIPNGLQLAAAATYYLNFSPNSGMTVRYSTDSGATWSTTPPIGQTSTWPDHKIVIQWWMNDPLPAGSTGNYVRYRATLPLAYGGPSFIENTACIGLGDAAPFACDTAWNIVQGTGSIGDFVWRDENNDGQQTGETAYGINGVAVSLYGDQDGDGQLGEGDLLLFTQDTYTYGGNPGYYQFTQLPAGNYLVVVDKTDTSIPTGYRLTTTAATPATTSSPNCRPATTWSWWTRRTRASPPATG